jgi:hypothetical protein
MILTHGPFGPGGFNVNAAKDAVVIGSPIVNVVFAPAENELLNGIEGGCFLIPIKIIR